MRSALIAAALLLPCAAAAQEQTPDLRFRYLGRASDSAVMATEVTGPETDRRLSTVVAHRTATGPGGLDTMVWRMHVDCTVPRIGVFESHTYVGTQSLSEIHDSGAWVPIKVNPGSALDVIVRFACAGEASEKEAQWFTGDAAARAFALDRAHDN